MCQRLMFFFWTFFFLWLSGCFGSIAKKSAFCVSFCTCSSYKTTVIYSVWTLILSLSFFLHVTSPPTGRSQKTTTPLVLSLTSCPRKNAYQAVTSFNPPASSTKVRHLWEPAAEVTPNGVAVRKGIPKKWPKHSRVLAWTEEMQFRSFSWWLPVKRQRIDYLRCCATSNSCSSATELWASKSFNTSRLWCHMMWCHKFVWVLSGRLT